MNNYKDFLLEKKNVKYIIKNPLDNYILPYFTINNKICELSNDNFIYNKFDFFSNRQQFDLFSSLLENDLNKCNKTICIPYNYLVNWLYVSLITTWSIGTGHGYAQIYDILINFKRLYSNFDDKKYKFLVYKNTQKGINDIINYFIPTDQIIYIDPEKVYKIDNFLHLRGNSSNKLDNIDFRFHEFLVPFFQENYYNKFDKNKPTYEKICIVKNDGEKTNVSSDRGFSYEELKSFCDINNYYMIDHSSTNMIDIIYLINNCEEILLSWGTAFFNHYIYISDKCKIISNFILENSGYHIYEYNRMGEFFKANLSQFRNAVINYYIVDKYLKNNPLIIREKEYLN